jgi:flagellar motor switch protein FliG
LGKAGSILPDVRHEALKEACELSMSDTAELRGGIEYSRQLLARAVGPRRGTEILERISVHQQLSSFEMLKNANPIEVAALLQEEMPQTIALVLSYLEAKVAADILTSMSKENQVEVTLRLAAMDRVSPQVVQQVEKNLKSKLSSVINEADLATGGSPFGENAQSGGSCVQKSILNPWRQPMQSWWKRSRQHVHIRRCIKLDDRAMQRVLRDVNKVIWRCAQRAPEHLKEKCSTISQNERET